MPRDVNGTTTPLPGTIVSSGDTLLPSQHNPAMEDLYAMMTQSLSRDGQGGMRANLAMSGFKAVNLGNGTDSQDAATYGQLTEISVNRGVPAGTVAMFRRKTAPDGWLIENGGTIGNASSGATSRANDDTLDLFTVLWNEFSNTELIIQTNAGVATTRGASAAADFAASKRLPLFDTRSRFPRASDSGLGYDTALIPGVAQADAFRLHNHQAELAGSLSHTHSIRGVSPGAGPSTGVVSGTETGFSDAVQTSNITLPGVIVYASGDSETRPRSSVFLFCIKL